MDTRILRAAALPVKGGTTIVRKAQMCVHAIAWVDRPREFTRTLLPARSLIIFCDFLLIFCYFLLFSVIDLLIVC